MSNTPPTHESIKTKILILGGGPAGMATAMELSKHNQSSTIIEKDKQVGGLAQTLVFTEGDKEFRTDIGPHRFFSKNQYLYDFIEDLIHEKWIRVPRQTRQLIGGKYYDYPIKALQAFRNIGLFVSFKMVISYCLAFVEYRIFKKPIKSFEDYIVANFGYELGRFNMLNYTEKIWGTPCSELHPDWAKQRIKGLNLVTAIKDAVLGGGKKKAKSLVDEFYYPQFGTGLIYDTIAKRIKETESQIRTNHIPTKLTHDGTKIKSVTIKNRTTGLTSEHKPEILVSSIPITTFLSLLDPAPPKVIERALAALKWRSQVYLFVTLDRSSVTKDNWIYIPDEDVPFGRLSEMKNFSVDMSPTDCTSLFIEFFVTEGDAIWNLSEKELFEHAMPHIERLGLFSRSEVRHYYRLERKFVYPVYDLHYPDNLAIVKEYLDGLKNLYYIGRPGRFKYNNQDHSIEMGIAAAQGIERNERPDFDTIGSESEYFEQGKLREEKTVRKPIANQSDKVHYQFIAYIICAGIATLVDITVLYISTTWLGIWYFYSAILGYLAGMATNFSLNKTLTFKNRSVRYLLQGGVFTLVAFVGLAINQAVIYWLVENADFDVLYAKIVSVAVVSIWSFTGHKLFTFGRLTD